MTQKKPWEMSHRELVGFLADIAAGFEGEVPGAVKIADAIRAHQRQPRNTKKLIHDVHLAHPEWTTLQIAHPEWTTLQIAEHTGASPGYVRACEDRYGWKARRLNADERSDIARAAGLASGVSRANKEKPGAVAGLS